MHTRVISGPKRRRLVAGGRDGPGAPSVARFAEGAAVWTLISLRWLSTDGALPQGSGTCGTPSVVSATWASRHRTTDPQPAVFAARGAWGDRRCSKDRRAASGDRAAGTAVKGGSP